MEKTLLASVQLKTDHSGWTIADIASEMEELAVSAGALVVYNLIAICDKPTPNYFVGRGKLEEIGMLAREEQADLVIFSCDLSGTQQRNIEQFLGLKTIDRTQLILDIFSRRASSPEGSMQVELAQLEYLLPRLSGKGVMLSRLGGGIGTRGPGEQKLEVDRRQIRKRVAKLKQQLKQFSLHRQNTKKRRKDNNLPSVVLVGYTSAGKSTLLNTLTLGEQLTSEKLFTTLDPVSKSLKLGNGQIVVISDTVGFLHQLPHHLIDAFKATLEETLDADLLIHVLDAFDGRIEQHNQAVFDVLKELGIEDKPVVTVLNKIDLFSDSDALKRILEEYPEAIPLSAKTKENLGLLLKSIEKVFAARMRDVRLLLEHNRMDLVDLFYRQARVNSIKYKPEGIDIKLTIPEALYRKISGERGVRGIC
ncbi:MAG: GTPase HflX [Candidatus Omnitrophota bacterium]